MLLIYGKTKGFKSSRFKGFLQSNCGLSSPLTMLAAEKVSQGERVAFLFCDVSALPSLDKLGLLYCFQA